jgi:hypothetical protein
LEPARDPGKAKNRVGDGLSGNTFGTGKIQSKLLTLWLPPR